MKWLHILLFTIAVFCQAGSLFAHEGHEHDEVAEQAETAIVKKYVCPMHADVQSDKPGECPKCGMTLKEMPKEEMNGEDSQKVETTTNAVNE